jgi:hypothetical protein
MKNLLIAFGLVAASVAPLASADARPGYHHGYGHHGYYRHRGYYRPGYRHAYGHGYRGYYRHHSYRHHYRGYGHRY